MTKQWCYIGVLTTSLYLLSPLAGTVQGFAHVEASSRFLWKVWKDSKLYGHRRVTLKFYVTFLKDFSTMLIAKVHCRLCNGPTLDRLLRQIKNEPSLYSCTLSKLYFNIVLISTPESARTSLSFRVSCKNVVGTDIHTSPPPPPSLCAHYFVAPDIWWRLGPADLLQCRGAFMCGEPVVRDVVIK